MRFDDDDEADHRSKPEDAPKPVDIAISSLEERRTRKYCGAQRC